MKVSEAKLDTPVLASGHLANAGAVCKAGFPRWGVEWSFGWVQTGESSQ